MPDDTEDIRRALVGEINEEPNDRERLEAHYGRVWDTEQLRRDFDVQGFMAPFVLVNRRSDDKRGTLMFQHAPRFYFSWDEA